MINVLVTKQSNYPVSARKIKKELSKFLEIHGIVSDSEVSVALVSNNKMLDLTKTYYNSKDKSLHSVLSFTADEAKKKFVYPPNGTLHLGEIVVCYPKALEEAKEENKLLEEKILELIEHGALHLLGIHHG